VEDSKRRPAIELALFLAAFFAVWSVRATYLYSIDDAIASQTLRLTYSALVKLVLWVVPAFGFARWVRRSSPFRYLGLSIAPSLRQWAWCLIITALFLGAIVSFETFAGGKTLSRVSLTFGLGGALFGLVTPVLEEILFRGLILKELSGLLRSWWANLLTSCLFVGIHLPFWLWHGGLTQTMLANCVGVLIFSLVAGWLYLRSGSIWPPALAHIANNYVAGLLVTGG